MTSLPASNQDVEWLSNSVLSIVVVGASGDLAKKMTFPSILNLFGDNLLPKRVRVWGFARSKISSADLREKLRPFMIAKGLHSESVIDSFLSCVHYQPAASYGDQDAFASLNTSMQAFEKEHADSSFQHRLFYFAIPPNVFAATALAIKEKAMQEESKGWTRLIVEKPFGRDLKSFEGLNKTLSEHFTEDHLYRIDHYLGKELVQNLTVLRFSNLWLEKLWNADNIKCVILTFKENFGTDGRGGYFDKFGIIRDVVQNHLLQVLSLMAMETPYTLEGPSAGKAIRDAKVAVLNAIQPISMDDAILGQYEGYADDPTIDDKGTLTPTFVVMKLRINTPRWSGVPFILKAGKALNEKKAEMRVQFKDAPAANFLFKGEHCPRNELVMRMQPKAAVYLKTNVKSPGFSYQPVQSELEVNYDTRFFARSKESTPDAYTRLILDVCHGKHAAFVRDDELRRAWEIFTPFLDEIEAKKVRPITYKQGGRGPEEADTFIREKGGYIRNVEYAFHAEGGKEAEPKAVVPKLPEHSPEEMCDGQNFALNMADHGFKVCVGNRSPAKVATTVQRAKDEGGLPIVGSSDIQDFVSRLKTPRKVVILVQAGKPVDATVGALSKYMQPGDIIFDGGNEWYPNSIDRSTFLKPKGIHFVGMGISGGEEGARNGPSLMPGGPKEAYLAMEPILKKCAAQVASGPCVGYLGPIGAGNYVKMVHNGIEYADMQLIAEVYDAMLSIGLTNAEMADIFDDWNAGELESYLIEITGSILRKKEEGSNTEFVVDSILDKTGSKGTGKWTVQEGADKGVAIPTIAAALDARMMSGLKTEREAASLVLTSPNDVMVNKDQVIDDLKDALYASKICSYAQGLSLIKTASDENGWDVDLAECARLWSGGCIIRAALLDDIQKAYSNKDLPNLMMDPVLSKKMNSLSDGWRRAVAHCSMNGTACPALMSSLSYFDTYRRGRLPANLTQAQRDFFGGHTYERVDKPGRFHTAWTDAHKDIGSTAERTAGES